MQDTKNNVSSYQVLKTSFPWDAHIIIGTYKNTRNELARLGMGTIFNIVAYI